jgi:hypothetical protein
MTLLIRCSGKLEVPGILGDIDGEVAIPWSGASSYDLLRWLYSFNKGPSGYVFKGFRSSPHFEARCLPFRLWSYF